jgi:hypothetical protein
MTLRMTATHIETWAGTRDAQAQLPLLVRHLIQSTAKTTALSMPGGFKSEVQHPRYQWIVEPVFSAATCINSWRSPT